MDSYSRKVTPGKEFKLDSIDPGWTGPFASADETLKDLKKTRKALNRMQERLYAEGSQALLIVLQGMDAAGKDGTIRKVMGSLNPQGVVVTPFKVPSAEEAAHDFLWRIHRKIPRAGMVGIFNRSHYEDVLVVRVREFVDETVWRPRYEQINAFEKMLSLSGVRILKIFLHISPEEQARRFRERIERPEKHWKFNPGDLEDRKLWWKFQKAYEEALGQCSTPHAPWHVIPADHKWFRNLAISQLLLKTLDEMNPQFPESIPNIGDYVVPEVGKAPKS